MPYTGGAPELTDLLGGHIDFAFGQAASQLAQVQSGQLKAFAVLQPKRWWAAPDVPTLDELGIPDIDASFWHGIWGAERHAAGRDRQAQCRCSRRRSPIPPCRSVSRKSARRSGRADQQTPDALAAKQKTEIAKWTPIIKETMPAHKNAAQ